MHIINHQECIGENYSKIPWWSLGKTVLATAIFVLSENNQVDLNHKYYDLDGTLGDLLRHESGLTDYGGVNAYHEAVANKEDAWPVEKLMLEVDGDRLIYEPGESWRYSNIGYLYIKQLIESVTKKNINEALKDLLFNKINIHDVSVVTTKEALLDSIGVIEDYDPNWVYHGLIMGSLSSACLFFDALSQGQLITRASLEYMLTPYELNFEMGDRPWKKPSYGYGVMIDNQPNKLFSYGHTGGGPGSVIAVYHFPNLIPPITVGSFKADDNGDFVENEVMKTICNLDR